MNQRATVTNALLGIGGYGPAIAGQNAAAIGSAGSDIANIQLGAGQARASGYLGQANALSNALGQAAMGYGLYKGGYFGQPSSGTGGGTGAYGGSAIPYTGQYGGGY